MQAAVIHSALQAVRHGELLPPLEEPCRVCGADAAAMLGLLLQGGWELFPRAVSAE